MVQHELCCTVLALLSATQKDLADLLSIFQSSADTSTTTYRQKSIFTMASNKARTVAADPPAPRMFFQDLPAELRNEIYKYRFIVLTKDGDKKPMTVQQMHLHFVMLQTLFRLMREALPVFLGANILHLTGTQRVYDSNPSFTPKWSAQTAPRPIIMDYAMRDCDREGHKCRYSVEVPPEFMCRYFKHVNVSLLGPYHVHHADQMERLATRRQMISDNRIIDWLEIIRNLPSYGFTRLERLSVEVHYREFGSRETETEFMDWTRKQIQGMVNAKELVVTFRVIPAKDPLD